MQTEMIAMLGVLGVAGLSGFEIVRLRRVYEQERAEGERREAQIKEELSQHEKTVSMLEECSTLAAREQRRAKELFGVVEQVLNERDQWREMWHTQSRAHLEAQNMLEQALTDARVAAISAIKSVNAYRKKAGQEPLPFGVEPGDKPVGSAAKFKAMLDQAEAEAPKGVDGVALRDEAMSAR